MGNMEGTPLLPLSDSLDTQVVNNVNCIKQMDVNTPKTESDNPDVENIQKSSLSDPSPTIWSIFTEDPHTRCTPLRDYVSTQPLNA